jgi:DNA replication licensing factor MCM4
LDEAGRVVSQAPVGGSDPASFTNRDPNTSEADALGGQDQSLIWGTTVSIDDTFSAFKEFLRNFTQKYRMYRDGLSDVDVLAAPDANSKPYWETLENMLLLGTTRLYLDIADLNLYPPTRKLWHQIQAYPQEIVPIMDQSVHDLMVELARAEDVKQRASQSSAGNQLSQQNSTQSSEVAFPSSDRPEASQSQRRQQEPSQEDQVSQSIYVVRPFGLDKSTNLRDLNPSGKYWGRLPIFGMLTLDRHGQTHLRQGFGHPHHARHPRYEGRILQVQRVQPLGQCWTGQGKDPRTHRVPPRHLRFKELHADRPQPLFFRGQASD